MGGSFVSIVEIVIRQSERQITNKKKIIKCFKDKNRNKYCAHKKKN